ncbi:MAG TPA: aromatic amino acid lyase, partial [Gemmatimonadales bacterium]|nr:aromatic amino acid lyase [Gemmatimonadales bacterium]
MIALDGRSLTLADVVAIARHRAPVSAAPAALDRVRASRAAVERAIARGDTMYGVNTGFGKLANVRIPPDKLQDLQRNLIRSH